LRKESGSPGLCPGKLVESGKPLDPSEIFQLSFGAPIFNLDGDHKLSSGPHCANCEDLNKSVGYYEKHFGAKQTPLRKDGDRRNFYFVNISGDAIRLSE
jgi:hypothetical protein